jgi:hypothetical protein
MQTTQSRVTRGENPSPLSSSTAMWLGVLFSAAFTALIWALGNRLSSVPHAPDTGAADYYWKLIDPTFVSRASAWGLYLAHQLVSWGLIYYAQTRVKRYTNGLHPVNVWALGTNAVFIGLHLLQTHFFYDGLAQDVSIFSSQGSVILLLVFVLIMENPRRGVFFGKKAPLAKDAVDFIRKYHGYFFSWAAIYTFWYHPAEASMGHLIGFFYMFLLMLQGSLFFTRIHTNKYWTFTQEFLVLIHGTLVAVMQGKGLWTMFAFGFGGIFIISQMYGLGLSRIARLLLIGVYCAGVIVVYSQKPLVQINEIIRIPVIDYLLVFVLTGLIAGPMWLYKRFATKTPALPS